MIGLDRNLKGKDLISKSSIHDSRRFRPSTSSALEPENAVTSNDELGGHWPEKMPARAGGTKKFAFLKCKVCIQKKLRKETSYRCKGCPDKPPLCPVCFGPYHDNLV
ncbi:unnamed protein product [Pieris macdunnoughi]|uniref:PiggyBac transposable element-derived protein 4 C-terminal zinc-finger domain-containing protein n=1 Tax=Pieris macdunnoughi TaxID=345717 RepID=A0A821XMU5_9NEOP|nr:unnamed protein product [Pieris macdunnoughi]